MVSGKCPHPWNKIKKGTFLKGHSQVNNGAGCFKKGHDKSPIELNRVLGKKRYKEGSHPFFIKNIIAHKLANKNKWYGIGKHNWQRLSKKIIKRDNFICQSCGTSLIKNKPNVHHIIPFSISKDNSESNLVSLCIPCHISIEHFTNLQYKEVLNGEQNSCINQERS